jgi:hypothetical protein
MGLRRCHHEPSQAARNPTQRAPAHAEPGTAAAGADPRNSAFGSQAAAEPISRQIFMLFDDHVVKCSRHSRQRPWSRTVWEWRVSFSYPERTSMLEIEHSRSPRLFHHHGRDWLECAAAGREPHGLDLGRPWADRRRALSGGAKKRDGARAADDSRSGRSKAGISRP